MKIDDAVQATLLLPSEKPSLLRSGFRIFRAVAIVLLVVMALFIASVAGFVVWVIGPSKATQWVTRPFFPPAMEAVRYSPRDVLADLGGMSVKIPHYFADFVEYNGDPGWGEKRQGPAPVRTQSSKLKSFGYNTRFPDMAGLSSPELIGNKASFNIYNTTWINVGVTTGEFFSGTGFLDRQTADRELPNTGVGLQNYGKLPTKEYGLTVYAPLGIDPKTNKPNRVHPLADDVFVHRREDGKVDAFIVCSNRPHQAAPCSHSFSLEPYAKAEISVIYRRGMLAQWQEIQRQVTAQLAGFKN